MNEIEIIEKAKVIGIGEDGINILDSIQDKIKHNMDIEKIAINQDVDKDYVRELLDGVSVLFLTYNSDDKKSVQIVNAIGYMADERRVLSIGLNSSQNEKKEEINLNKEFNISDENRDVLLNTINMLLDSISYECMINMDLSDLKELLCCEGAIKYSQGVFSNESYEEIVNHLHTNAIQTGEEFSGKKQVVLVEMDSNFCEDEKETIQALNELLMEIEKHNDKNYESIFSLYIKEDKHSQIKVGLMSN